MKTKKPAPPRWGTQWLCALCGELHESVAAEANAPTLALACPSQRRRQGYTPTQCQIRLPQSKAARQRKRSGER